MRKGEETLACHYSEQIYGNGISESSMASTVILFIVNSASTPVRVRIPKGERANVNAKIGIG